jgi:hypothetical protein
MADAPVVEKASAATRRRTIAFVVLLAVAGFLVLSAGWAAWRVAAESAVAPIGAQVAIPDGHLSVDDIDHVPPSELGGPLPDGSHAVQVNVTLTADEGTELSVATEDFVIEGTGISGALSPSRVSLVAVPAGGVAPVALVFAVPDESTDLVMLVPGGARVTAEHPDHPGDAEQ